MGSRDFLTELTKSTYSSDFVDLKMHYFSHAPSKTSTGWHMKGGVTEASESLVKTLGFGGENFFVDINKVDHVIEMELLCKGKEAVA